MDTETLLSKFEALSPEAQRQVADFIAFLYAREQRRRPSEQPVQTPLREEPFIGMWQDRTDPENASAWVRAIRKREW